MGLAPPRIDTSMKEQKSRSDLLHEKYFPIYTQFKKSACEACGFDGDGRRDEDGFLRTKPHIKLTVHHLDKNVRNNDPSNLQTLCRPCHDLVHQ